MLAYCGLISHHNRHNLLSEYRPAQGWEVHKGHSGEIYMRHSLGVILLFIVGPVWATTIFQHSGSTDPYSEGWTTPYGVGGTIGPINDGGTQAWIVDDNSSADGSHVWYTQTPTAQQHLDAAENGWVLRVNVRIVDIPDPINNAGSLLIQYSDGSTSYNLALGSEGDGDPLVLLQDGGFTNSGTIATGAGYTLQDGGSGYHLYELIYDPLAASTDLFIDGNEVLSNYSGFATVNDGVSWGSGTSYDTGQGNWNLVQFSVVPIPASVWLFGSALAGLGWIRRKQAA
jgi:hypothetical protein